MPRKPFSNKQKKEQLQKKREKKRNLKDNDSDSESNSNDEKVLTTLDDKDGLKVNFANTSVKLNEQPRKDNTNRERNRFNLEFMRESYDVLKRNKKNSFKPLIFHDKTELEVNIEDFYKPGSPLDFPIRPKWSYETTKEKLDQNEKIYFEKYLNKIFDHYHEHELSYFEMNLETWRQLWRVLEISDIILLIVDIRFPALHFSPTFYNYCIEHDKDVILVLNKIDMVPTSLVIAWKNYFKSKYSKLHVLLFSSSKQIKIKRHKQHVYLNEKKNEADGNLNSKPHADIDEEAAIKSAAAEIYTARAHRHLFECINEIIGEESIDLTSWDTMTEKLVNESLLKVKTSEEEEACEGTEISSEDAQVMDDLINSRKARKKFEHGFVTIGCCGFPNVGKSSLLNSLKGRKVVSVSKTPGHTKHLQTIFLTQNVRLCDCPGLVFPSLSAKPLQVLAGIYPIAQLQEPYSAIRYLAENIPMIEALKIEHPSVKDYKHDQFYSDKKFEWTPSDICEAWALKRGYITAKAARPDVYRAANELLRMALDGRLCLSLKPTDYFKNEQYWKDSQETHQLDDIVMGVEVTVKENLERLTLSNELSDYEEIDECNNEPFESCSNQEEDVDDNISKNPYALLEQD